MNFSETVREFLPRVSDALRLAQEHQSALNGFFSLPKSLDFYEHTKDSDYAVKQIEGISDDEREELELALQFWKEAIEELQSALDKLRPAIVSLCKLPVDETSEETLTCLATLVSGCIDLDRQCPPYKRVEVPEAESGGTDLLQPWFAAAVGQLLANMLPRARTASLDKAAGDWIRLIAADKFLPVIKHHFDGEDFTLADWVKGVAEGLCGKGVRDRCTNSEVLLALDRIAERLGADAAALWVHLDEGLLLYALESTPSVASTIFVSLVTRIARKLLSGDEDKERWPRFAKLLWSQHIEQAGVWCDEDCCRDNPFYVFGNRQDIDLTLFNEDYDNLSIEERLVAKLTAAFWLSRIYQRMGDEGREFFCSHIFQTYSYRTKLWNGLRINLGWTEAEANEILQRFEKELLPRFRESTPWPLTSVIPRVELTSAQMAAFAREAAAQTSLILLNNEKFKDTIAAEVEPDLMQGRLRKVWCKLPPDTRTALTAATFVERFQPERSDYSGAVVLDWKALEIALCTSVFDTARKKLELKQQHQSEGKNVGIPLRMKLVALANAIANPCASIEHELRDVLEKQRPKLLKWSSFYTDFNPPLGIRNTAAHEKPVSRTDFETSRAFVFKLLHALYNETMPDKP